MYVHVCLNIGYHIYMFVVKCRLDYCGISLLIMGSAVPWLYYSFYCRLSTKIIYLAIIISLGIICITISMLDRFSRPDYRPIRAG